MGAYLSTPVTDKEVEEGEGPYLQYGVAAMQGWRRTMEDGADSSGGSHLGSLRDIAPCGGPAMLFRVPCLSSTVSRRPLGPASFLLAIILVSMHISAVGRVRVPCTDQ